MDNTKELIQQIGAILRGELNLKEDQTVLYNQAFEIPPDDRLYISVGVLGGRNFAVKTKYMGETNVAELNQQQGVNRQELVSIQLYSKSDDALTRNWEVPLALNSTRAQQVQEKYSFKIGNLPVSMVDVSDPEGAHRLYRYALTVAVLVAYRKTTPVDFYDSFQTPVITSNQ